MTNPPDGGVDLTLFWREGGTFAVYTLTMAWVQGNR